MKTEKLLSFHNDQKVKEKYLDRVKKHYELDEIIKDQTDRQKNLVEMMLRRD